MCRRQDFFRRLFNRRVSTFTLAGGNRRSGLGFFGASMSTPQETALRRIALTAALVATLAGGAAALAATPDAGTPDATPPDPYQGAWALTIDGRAAGAIAQVQGCGLAALIVGDGGPNPGKHLANPGPEPCTFQAGAGMTPDFVNLINDGLTGQARGHDIELIRTDPAAHYGLQLSHAHIASIGLPRIDRASTAPVFLEVSVEGDVITRDPAPTLVGKPLPLRGFDPARLRVAVGGTDLGASSAGPWNADIKPTADIGRERDSLVQGAAVDIGNLPLRVPENSKAMTTTLDPWVHAALVDGGAGAEKPVKLSLGGLALTFDRSAPQRADLVPRADGARTYSLYAEHAVIAAS